MGHVKHRDCSHALEEDAPKVWGHGSNSKWVKGATERQTPWSGGFIKKAGRKICGGIQYILWRNSRGSIKQKLNHLWTLKMMTMASLIVDIILLPLPLSSNASLWCECMARHHKLPCHTMRSVDWVHFIDLPSPPRHHTLSSPHSPPPSCHLPCCSSPPSLAYIIARCILLAAIT